MLRMNEIWFAWIIPDQNDDLKAMVYEIAPEGKIKIFQESSISVMKCRGWPAIARNSGLSAVRRVNCLGRGGGSGWPRDQSLRRAVHRGRLRRPRLFRAAGGGGFVGEHRCPGGDRRPAGAAVADQRARDIRDIRFERRGFRSCRPRRSVGARELRRPVSLAATDLDS